MQAGTVMEASGKCQVWEEHSWTLEVIVRILGAEEKKEYCVCSLCILLEKVLAMAATYAPLFNPTASQQKGMGSPFFKLQIIKRMPKEIK